MDKQKRIEKLKSLLFNDYKSRYHICGECSSFRCERDGKPHCGNYAQVAEVLLNADWGDLKDFSIRLKRKIQDQGFDELCQDCSASQEIVFNCIDELLMEYQNDKL